MSIDDIRGEFFTPPWSRIQALNEMTAEAGIDFDEFILAIEQGQSVEEMTDKFKVSSSTIESLQQHFYRYGISSVIGGD